MPRTQDTFRGCLVGGAAGDALGYAVEFLNEEWIRNRYGSAGISEYALRNGVAEISDDTQMTLFTANGLLYGNTCLQMNGTMESYQSYIRTMYKCWYRTQYERYSPDEDYKYSWLLDVPELFNARAPGNTCLSALASDLEGSIADPINGSKGCGGVMRVAPIGLYFSGKKISDDEVDLIGAESAAITHGHDLGYIPAAALVHIIRKICEGMSVRDAVVDSVSAVARVFEDKEHIIDFVKLMNEAVELADSDEDDLTAIHMLGEGWVAEETLAIAAFCAIRYCDDFDRALRVSVNHNGDSDSTGAVTGNILGAYIGYDAIPQKYKDNLELRDVLIEMADDLCREYDSKDHAWYSKYVEGRRA